MERSSIIVKVFLLAGALLAGLPGVTFGGTLNPGPSLNLSNPLLVPVLSQCVMLGKRSGREVLINRCNACQIVKLKRKRPGSEPAIRRTYTVPAKSTTDLSFRGPGQSRVTSSTPCVPQASKSQQRQDAETQCAQFQRRIDGGLIIINTCNSCREVFIERLGAGNFKSNKTFTIAAKAYVPVSSENASQARILAEKKCGR